MSKRIRPSLPSPRTDVPWPQQTRHNLAILAFITAAFFYTVFLHPNRMLWGNDIVRAHSEYRQVQWQSFWEWHSFPLWDPTIYCGKSIVGDSLPAVLEPLSFLFWLIPSPILFGYFLWLQVTLGAWGTFLFARIRGCTPLVTCVAAVAFALGGKTAAHVFAGHVELLSTALGLPWILWATERLLRKPGIPGACLLGAVTTLVATNGRRVNHNFVGVAVGAGGHELRVWYHPWDFYLGCLISAAVWAAMLCLAAFRAFRARASG